jgi:hypothetical protein
VTQTNNATFTNNVDVHANTGDNHASDNTGGDVTVNTGSADTTVTVANAANANTAVLGSGTGTGGGVTAAILGNGSDSDNNIHLDMNNSARVTQSNTAHITNDVDVNANTGDNHASDNTGGDVSVMTGDATTHVGVDNMANFNAADVNNCGCLTDLTAKIIGNGSNSDNTIHFDGDNTLGLHQTNSAWLNNRLEDLFATTGKNHASDNTGSVSSLFDPVSVDTGSSNTTVDLGNSANMNQFGSDLTGMGDWLSHQVSFNFDMNGLLGFFWGHSI